MNQQPMGAPKPAVSKWLWITLIVVAVAAVGFFGWYYLMGPGKKTATSTTPTTTSTTPSTTTTTPSTTTTTPAADKTTGWKTYTNTNYLFSFKYPIDWEIKEDTTLKDTTGKAYLISVMYRPNTMKEDYAGGVSIINDTLADVITEQKNAFKDNSTFKGQSIAKVGGVDATTLTFQNNVDSSVKPVIYLIEKDNKVYKISGEGSSSSTEINEIIKTILSTFKFTQ